MSVERARATWTDERLDDLARSVERGFNRVDEDLRSLRTDLGTRIDTQGAELGARIDAQGAELGARIDAQTAELGARIDAMQRTMLQFGGGIIGAILVAIVSLIATQA